MKGVSVKGLVSAAGALALSLTDGWGVREALAYNNYQEMPSFGHMDLDSQGGMDTQRMHSGAMQSHSRRSQEMDLRHIDKALDHFVGPIYRSNKGSGERYNQLLPNSRRIGTSALSMLPETHPLRVEARARRGRNRSAQVLLIGAILGAVYLVPYLYMSRGGGSLKHTERFQAVYDRISSSASGSFLWLMAWRLFLGVVVSGALNLGLNLYRLEHATDMRGKKMMQSKFWNHWELFLGVPLLLLVISSISGVDPSRRLVEPLSQSLVADAVYQTPFGLAAVGLLSLLTAAVSKFLVALKRSNRRPSEGSGEALRDGDFHGSSGGGAGGGRWDDLRDDDVPTALGRDRYGARRKKHTRNFSSMGSYSGDPTQSLSSVPVADPWEDIFGEQALLPQEEENAERRTRRRRSYRTRDRTQGVKKRTKTRTKTGRFLHRQQNEDLQGAAAVDDPRGPEFEDSLLGTKARDRERERDRDREPRGAVGAGSAERKPTGPSLGGAGEVQGSVQKEHRRHRHTKKLTTLHQGTRRLKTNRTRNVVALLKNSSAAELRNNPPMEGGADPLSGFFGDP